MTSRVPVRAYVVALCLAFVLVLDARAQTDPLQAAGAEALDEIHEALRSGDVRSLIERSGRRLDVTIFGSSELLSRSQGKYVLKEFFRAYRPERVVFHDSSPSGGNWFASASYWYENGDGPLSVYLRMRVNDSQWVLRELRIGRSDER